VFHVCNVYELDSACFTLAGDHTNKVSIFSFPSFKFESMERTNFDFVEILKFIMAMMAQFCWLAKEIVNTTKPRRIVKVIRTDCSRPAHHPDESVMGNLTLVGNPVVTTTRPRRILKAIRTERNQRAQNPDVRLMSMADIVRDPKSLGLGPGQVLEESKTRLKSDDPRGGRKRENEFLDKHSLKKPRSGGESGADSAIRKRRYPTGEKQESRQPPVGLVAKDVSEKAHGLLGNKGTTELTRPSTEKLVAKPVGPQSRENRGEKRLRICHTNTTPSPQKPQERSIYCWTPERPVTRDGISACSPHAVELRRNDEEVEARNDELPVSSLLLLSPKRKFAQENHGKKRSRIEQEPSAGAGIKDGPICPSRPMASESDSQTSHELFPTARTAKSVTPSTAELPESGEKSKDSKLDQTRSGSSESFRALNSSWRRYSQSTSRPSQSSLDVSDRAVVRPSLSDYAKRYPEKKVD